MNVALGDVTSTYLPPIKRTSSHSSSWLNDLHGESSPALRKTHCEEMNHLISAKSFRKMFMALKVL